MSTPKVAFALLLMLALAGSGCGAAAPASVAEPAAPAKEVMAEKPTDEAMAPKEAGDEAMREEQAPDEAMMEKDQVEGAMVEEKASDEAMMEEKASETAMKEDTGEAMLEDKETSGETMAMEGEEAMAAPTWFETELINVNTGETFKIDDFKGQVVLVETMAIWCTTCLRQQTQVQALHETLGERDDFVSLALDIDPNEEAEDLKAYAAEKGFDWTYAVAPPQVAREIGQLYGSQFLNPPSAPIFIIDRQGQVHPLPFGVKDGPTLQAALTPFLNAG